MPTYFADLPNGQRLLFDHTNPDLTDDQIREIALNATQAPPALPAPTPAGEEPSALGAAVTGFKQVFGAQAKGLGSLIGAEGLERYGEGVTEELPQMMPFSEVEAAYGEGLPEGLAATGQYLKENLAMPFGQVAAYAPQMFAGAKLGAAAVPVPYIPAKAAGAFIGGAAPLFLSHQGENITRQEQERAAAIARGEEPPEMLSPLATIGTSAAQATIDRAGLSLLARALPVLKPVLGMPTKELADDALVKIANRSLASAAMRGAGVAAATEVPTELATTILQRNAAGLPLTTPDALDEYKEVAIAAGVGATGLGALGGAARRSGARSEQEFRELQRQTEADAAAAAAEQEALNAEREARRAAEEATPEPTVRRPFAPPAPEDWFPTQSPEQRLASIQRERMLVDTDEQYQVLKPKERKQIKESLARAEKQTVAAIKRRTKEDAVKARGSAFATPEAAREDLFGIVPTETRQVGEAPTPITRLETPQQFVNEYARAERLGETDRLAEVDQQATAQLGANRWADMKATEVPRVQETVQQMRGSRPRMGETFGGPQQELGLIAPAPLTETKLQELGLPKGPVKRYQALRDRLTNLDLTQPEERRIAIEEVQKVDTDAQSGVLKGKWAPQFVQNMNAELARTEDAALQIMREREIAAQPERDRQAAVGEEVEFAATRGLEAQQAAADRAARVEAQAQLVRDQATGRLPISQNLEAWKDLGRMRLQQNQEEARLREQGLDQMAAEESAMFELDMQYVDDRITDADPMTKADASAFVQQYREAQAINDPALIDAVDVEARAVLGSTWGILKGGLKSRDRGQARRLEREARDEVRPEQPDLFARAERQAARAEEAAFTTEWTADNIKNHPWLNGKDPEGLDAMVKGVGWSEVGGRLLRDDSGVVTGLTPWVPRERWWADKPKEVTEKLVKSAYDKIKQGQADKLNKAERRSIAFLAETDQQLKTEEAEFVRAERQAAEQMAEDRMAAIDARALEQMDADQLDALKERASTSVDEYASRDAYIDEVERLVDAEMAVKPEETRPDFDLTPETEEQRRERAANLARKQADDAETARRAEISASQPPLTLAGSPGEADMAAAAGQTSLFPSVGANEVTEKPKSSRQAAPKPKLPETIEVDGVQRPTVNSAGQPIHSTEKGLRNFWRWFGDSDVVDAQGRPLVVYHGTLYDFTEFKFSDGRTMPGYFNDLGYFFDTGTDYPADILLDKEGKQYREGANIMPVYVKGKLMPLDSLEDLYDVAIEGYAEKADKIWEDNSLTPKEKSKANSNLLAEVFRKNIRDSGYNGVYVKEGDGSGIPWVVAFDADQVKSAVGNVGKFSPKKSDIRYSRESTQEPIATVRPDGLEFDRLPPGIEPKGMLTKDVQDIADQISKALPNAPEIIVKRSQLDPRLPKELVEDERKALAEGKGASKGVYYDGKVYLFSENLADADDAKLVGLHEILGHDGLRMTFGDTLRPILRQIVQARGKDIEAFAKEYGYSLKTDEDKLVVAEEVLANLAMTKPELGFVKRAIAAIRRFARTKLGMKKLELTDNDIIANFIIPARAFAEGKLSRAARDRLREYAGSLGPERGGATVNLRQSRTDIDKEYFDAIERGDMETAQRMVDEAAKRAGYTTKGYHGSPDFIGTEFNREYLGRNVGLSRGGFSFAPDRESAEAYASTEVDPEQFVVDAANKVLLQLQQRDPDKSWSDPYGNTWEDLEFQANNIDDTDEFINYLDDLSISLRDTFPDLAKEMQRATLAERDPNPKVIEAWLKDPERVDVRGRIAYIAKDPASIKMADPVLYDDNGNVIPLSQRFDISKPDIRYSRQPAPSQRRTPRQIVQDLGETIPPPEQPRSMMRSAQQALTGAFTKTNAQGQRVRRTAADYRKLSSTFGDFVATNLLSKNTAVEAGVRRAMQARNASQLEQEGRLLAMRDSQVLHRTHFANIFMEFGKAVFDNATQKYKAVQSRSNFKNLTKELSSLAKDMNVPEHEVTALWHNYMVARRLDDLRQQEAQTMQQVQALRAKGKKKKADDLQKKFTGRVFWPDDKIDAGLDIARDYPEVVQLADMWNDIRSNVLDLMVTSGTFTREKAEEYMDRVGYAPFFREGQLEAGDGPREYLSKLVNSPLNKRLTASDKPVNNMLENMMRWTGFMVETAVGNHNGRRIIEELENNGLATPVPNPDAVPRDDRNRLVEVYQNGVKRSYLVEDPLMVKAFEGLGPAGPVLSGILGKFMGSASELLRKTVTMNPVFTVAQLTQDAFGAMMTSGLPPQQAIKLPVEVLKEFIQTINGTSASHETLRRYGAVGERAYNANFARDAMENRLTQLNPETRNQLRTILDKFEFWSMASDNAVRQAVYKLSLANGDSMGVAVERAFEIINFRRQGSLPLIHTLARVTPFMNAYMQSLKVQMDLLSGGGIAPGKARREVWRAAIMNAMMLAGLSFVYAMLVGGDEEYEQMDDLVRDRMFYIPGLKMGVPLRSDMTLLPKIMGEQIYRLSTDAPAQDMPQFRQSVSRALVNTITSPTPLPQLFKPMIENVINYSFWTNRPLVSPRLQELTPSLQRTPYTSQLATLLGENMNISPIKIDNWVQGTFGSLGGLVLWVSDNFGGVAGLRPSRDPFAMAQAFPGMGRFLTQEHSSGLRSMFYEADRLSRVAYQSYMDRVKNQPLTANPYLERGSNLARVAAFKEFNQISKELGEIRRNIDRIGRDVSMDPDIRAYIIDQLRDQEQMILEFANIKDMRERIRMFM